MPKDLEDSLKSISPPSVKSESAKAVDDGYGVSQVMTGLSIGITSPENTLEVQNSPVTNVGEISLDLVNQSNLTSGTYVNPNISVNQKGVITAISGGSSALNAVNLTSQKGTMNISNGTINGSNPSCNVDLQAIQGIEGQYVNPIVQFNHFGQAVFAQNNPPVPGTGTVTSVALGSTKQTLSVSGTNPITGAGVIDVDLAEVSGLPAQGVPCPSVSVDGFGRVIQMSASPALSLSSPEQSLTIGDPSVSTEKLSYNIDVAPSGVHAGAYALPLNLNVGSDGRITSVQSASNAGIVQNITSTGNSIAITPPNGTQSQNQSVLNIDLPANPQLAGTFNGISVNQYGVVTHGIDGQYLNQVNMSSPQGTLVVSNGAITKNNNSTTLDLRPVVSAGTYNNPTSITVNAYGQITSVSCSPSWRVVGVGSFAITNKDATIAVQTNVPSSTVAGRPFGVWGQVNYMPSNFNGSADGIGALGIGNYSTPGGGYLSFDCYGGHWGVPSVSKPYPCTYFVVAYF